MSVEINNAAPTSLSRTCVDHAISQVKPCLLYEPITFDPKQYNQLFDEELQKVIARTSDPAHRQALESMRGFGWMGYIAASVRHAGFHDQREIQEKSHDVGVKLLMGTLFKGFDQHTSGPLDLRYKRSVSNAIKNLVEKEKNRRHYLPTVPIDQQCEPSGMMSDDGGEKIIRDFRRLVRRRLGQLGVAVLDVRLHGGETKSLVGSSTLGGPGRWSIKRAVQQIKELAQDYAVSLGDSTLLRSIAKAMARERDTVAKRRTAMAKQAMVA